MNSVRAGGTADLMRKKKSGQTMTETIIVVGLIAVAAIAVVAIFGKQIRAGFVGLTGGMAGTGAAVTDHRGAASGEETKDRTMSSFD